MYERPELYDEVFAYRDFEAEAAFVKAAYARHCPGRPLEALLELGCGPARHATLLAQSVPRVWALDASGEMLRYAARLAGEAGAELAFIQGDMADFEIEGMEGQLDLAACLLGTFSHMVTNDQAVAAFTCIAKHLRPGGVLLLELAHPGDLFDGGLVIGDEGGEMWDAESRSLGCKLLIEWGADGDDFDPATQVMRRSVAVCKLEGGEPGELVHASVVAQRAFTLQELDLLGRIAGLQLARAYGDLSLGVGLGHEDAYRLVAAFVKGG
ncbi:MAG: S-adenosyl-L-methionine-dependent methyltransferase [Monoraphidium minutum]|nr:MAG: S-adenosyl-L-methionine-dependent methyltransferase [Monoraphidium minutum]